MPGFQRECAAVRIVLRPAAGKSDTECASRLIRHRRSPAYSGAAVDTRLLTLTAADDNRFAAYEVRRQWVRAGRGAGTSGRARTLSVLPGADGSGLPNAASTPWRSTTSGRTAGGHRDEAFDYMPHVRLTTHDGVKADAAAAVAHLRSLSDAPIFTIDSASGEQLPWHQAANGLGLAGAIGFYGHPDRVFPPGSNPLVERVGEMTCPILGLMAGDDQGNPGGEPSRSSAPPSLVPA